MLPPHHAVARSFSSATATQSDGSLETNKTFTMARWFRSAPMEYISLIVNEDAAHDCLSELGNLGVIQFTDVSRLKPFFEEIEMLYKRTFAAVSNSVMYLSINNGRMFVRMKEKINSGLPFFASVGMAALCIPAAIYLASPKPMKRVATRKNTDNSRVSSLHPLLYS